MSKELEQKIFDVTSDQFEAVAIEVFKNQFHLNRIYQHYCQLIGIYVNSVTSLVDIPFLPIQFFKNYKITTGEFNSALIFESSGTSGSVNSLHHLKDPDVYEKSFLKTFLRFYGNPGQYCIIGLLPSYLERKNSSLVYMVNELIRLSGNAASGFYLYDYFKLRSILEKNEASGIKTFLIGVTYALLDFAETTNLSLKHTIVMETGGMKGRREELTRAEVHAQLCRKLGIETVHSEYGMTELLSQAYAIAEGRFVPPSWMKIILREPDDPFELTIDTTSTSAKTGVLNVIDLANLYSCSFIATDDIAKLFPDGSFEVLGRIDNSDIRGCGLMIT